ncbi:retrovirus-related pol polyprotein from transposon TNT 1-94 [Tanacetum coccineum]
MVKDSLQRIKDHLTKFDVCIENRTVILGIYEGSWGVSDIKDAYIEEVVPFVTNLKESFKLFEMGLYKEYNEMKVIFKQMEHEVNRCSVEKKYFEIEKKKLLINNDRLLEDNISCDVMFQKIEDDNVSLAFQLRAQLQAKVSEPHVNYNGTSVNTKFAKPPTLGNKLYYVTLFPKTQFIPKVVEKNDLSKIVTSHLHTNKVIEKCTKVLAPGLLRIETEPINAYSKNNRAVHQDYLKVTKEHRIQELLVYVNASCPFTQSENEKWAPTTSHKKNNKPYVDTSVISKIVDNNTQKYVVKQDIQKTDNTLLPSTRRVSYTNASGSQRKSNTRNDRILRPSSRSEKNKVEVQPRKFKSISNKNNHVSYCNANVKNVVLKSNSENICLSCNECLFSTNHDACVVKYLKDVKKHKKAKTSKQREKNEWKPTGWILTTIGHRWIPTGRTFNLVGNQCPLTRITPAIVVPPGQILTTTVISTVEPRKPSKQRYDDARNSFTQVYLNSKSHPMNDHDLGIPSASKVLDNNLNFIVEIVLWYLDSGCSKHMTGQRDKLINFVSKFIGTVRFGHGHFVAIMGYNYLPFGNILTRVYYVEGLGSRGFNLYSISLNDIMKSSTICLLSKALKTKSWLWHHRLSHLNFGTINQLAKEGLVRGLPKLKYTKDHLCSASQMGKSKKESHKPKSEPNTNERLQMLHMDHCGPMRVESINGKRYILVIVDDYSRFTWVKILRTKDETPETLRSYMEEVGITHQTSIARTPQQNGLLPNQAASTSAKHPSKNDFVLYNRASSSTTIDQYAPPPSTTSKTETTTTLLQSSNIKEPNDKDVEFDSGTFTNPFAPPVTNSVESSSRIVDTSNMHTFQQPQTYIRRWTKDHPLVTIIDNPSKPIFIRRQLTTDAMWCYFHAFLTKVEPKNYKEAMNESSWIEAMQEEIHEFERLKVWELVPRPSDVMLINLKWIFKVKLDEYESFVDQDHPNHVFRLKKALYDLKQAPRAWYDMLSKFLLNQKFIKGVVDPELLTRKEGRDLILMSMMGKISFLLGLQVSQHLRGILINQLKYALEMLAKYGLKSCDAVNTPMVERSKLDEEPQGTEVDHTRYRSMDKLIEKHLTAVKRVFWYLKGTINMGLWYLKDTRFDLTAFADTDHAGCQDTRRSTSGSA